MKLKDNKVVSYALLLLPFIVVVLLYEVIPLITTLLNGFKSSSTGAFTLENFQEIFSKTIYKSAITNSIKISIVSAIIGLIIAFLAAKAYSEGSTKLKNIFTMILNMTSNFSGMPLAFGFMLLLGNAGFLRMLALSMDIHWLDGFDLYSSDGLTLIYIYFQIPLATLLLIPAFNGIKKEWKEAALLLNTTGIKFWTKIGVPILMPSILGTLSVLFSNALAAYATAYALFLNNFALLPLQITKQYKGDVTIDKGLGGALSLILIVLMLIATGINNYFVKRQTKGAK